MTSLLAFILDGGWRSLALDLHNDYKPCLVAAPLVLFVAFSVAPRRPVQVWRSDRVASTARRTMFFLAKAVLVLCLAFLLSVDCCAPLALSLPNAAQFCHVLLFVLLATTQLRWSFQDQEARCKECLRLLAAPTRVGRPSHNLLEWNGTQIACELGHGRLRVPELETSWRQSSEWMRECKYRIAHTASMKVDFHVSRKFVRLTCVIPLSASSRPRRCSSRRQSKNPSSRDGAFGKQQSEMFPR